jgi:hypothetical protein
MREVYNNKSWVYQEDETIWMLHTINNTLKIDEVKIDMTRGKMQ